MIKLQSITDYFTTHSRLRLSQRKTLAALVWALMRKPLLGIAAIGHSLAMAWTALWATPGSIWRSPAATNRDRHWVRAPGLSHPGLDRSEDQRWPVSNPEY